MSDRIRKHGVEDPKIKSKVRHQNGFFKNQNKYAIKKGEVRNPNGRPRVPEIELFRKAREQVEAEKKIPLFIHALRRAYESDKVLIAIIKRILPESIDLPEDTKSLLEQELLRRQKGKSADEETEGE